jgi:tetratricopeptide (TPR) repeat protein
MRLRSIIAAGCLLLLPGGGTAFSRDTFAVSFRKGEEAFDRLDFENANLHFQQAIARFTASEDSLRLGKCYLYLGMLYGKLNNLPRAKEYVLVSNGIFERGENDTLLIRSCNILGNIYAQTGDPKRALAFYLEGLNKAKALRLYDQQGSLFNNIGTFYYERGDYAQAIPYFKEGLAIARKLHSRYGTGLSMISIGGSYAKLKQYPTAIGFIENGIAEAKAIDDLYILQIGYSELASAYAATGNHEAAYRYLSLYNQVHDSIASKEISQRVVELEKQYNSQRKEVEILHLKTVNQKNRIRSLEAGNKIRSLQYTAGIFLLLLVIIVVVFILFFRQYRHKLALSIRLSENKAELEQKNEALNASLLRNRELQTALKHDLDAYKQLAYRKQMNPHFIFNSLNSIQHYILTNDKLQANHYLGELSTLIRRILENSEKETVPLREELFVCETYIGLEQKRFAEKFRYERLVDEDLDLSAILIPPMLLQPFIENAIWHGLLHTSKQALLQLIITASDQETTVIRIKDNGVGRNHQQPTMPLNENKQESLGINLTMNRINLNNILTDNTTIAMEIVDLFNTDHVPAGTEVIITLQTTAHGTTA